MFHRKTSRGAAAAAAFAVAVTAFTLASPAAFAADTPPNPLVKPGYTLDFSEEFTGTTLDTSKWLPNYLPHWVPAADIADTAARYTISNGTIKLRVDQDQPPWNPDQDGTVVSSAIQTFNQNNWHKFNSSAVNRNNLPTFNGYSTKYGYVEVRAKNSNAGGVGHQALWLVGTNTTGGQSEIDMIETFFSTPNSWRIAAYGWGDPNFLGSWSLDTVPVSGSPTTEFHIYAMDWTPTQLRFYYDGQLVKTLNDAPNTAMGIIMNIYTGAGSGQPNSVWPKQWEVDYLRVYKDNAGYSEAVSPTWKLINNRHRAGAVNVEPNDGIVRFGEVPSTYWSAQWVPETTASGTTKYRNRWTNLYLYVSGSTVRHGTAATAGTAAEWSTPSAGSGYTRIQNASGALHVENGTGSVEFGNVPTTWWSSHWQLNAAPAN
jgi:hypothetical protein